MKNLFSILSIFLALAFFLPACSNMPQTSAGDPPEYFASLSEKDAEQQLEQVQRDIDDIDKQIRGAESRRDQALMKQSTDASKDSAAEGSAADLDSLQSLKGTLIQRQLQLEKRIRELQGPAI